MVAKKTCADCGRVLPTEPPGAGCPFCLLKLGLRQQDEPAMRPGSNESDQNLLMGLMALQLAMITPEEFVEALAASVPGSQAPLTDHLEAREILTLSQCQMLEGLVREILRHSGGDPSSSLALFGGRERISHILRGSSRREDASMLASEMDIPLDAEAFNTAALDAP